MDKKKWIKHIPLFILELIVLIAAAGALYVVLRTTGKNGVKKDRIDTEHIAVNEEVKEKIQAVSYTHLDVYKRQAVRYRCFPLWMERISGS